MISCGELYYDHFSKFLREPISREVFENSDLITYGAEKFEELLEEKNVDPFNVSRESVN